MKQEKEQVKAERKPTERSGHKEGMGSFWSLRDSEEESKERSNSVMDGNRDTSSVHSYLPLRNENSTANGFRKSRANSCPIKVFSL